MSAITWSDVTAHAPTLDTALSARVDILNAVNTHFNAATFGGESSHKLRLVRIYLAAHLATTTINGSSSGALMSESEGGLSRTYAVASTSDVLQSSMWGRMLDSLLRASPARAGFIL